MKHVTAAGVIAIGASAGGVDALQRLIGALPEDLPAAVCVVLHIPASSRSLLARIIARQTALPVEAATHGAPLRPGHVYVAPPDHHLRVAPCELALDRGPKENGVRPAVDPLFRSVAEHYGQRGMAVVLSGALSDGAAGAGAVAAAGGAVLVQRLEDAIVPSMPESTLATVPGARSDVAQALAGELSRWAAELPPPEPKQTSVASHETPIVPNAARGLPDGPPVPVTCPECHGPLWELGKADLVHYRCRVGHVYAADALLLGKGEAIESALWVALEALEERRELLAKVAERLSAAGRHRSAAQMREAARSAGERAELIRGALAIDGDDAALQAEAS